ncbi:MAG: sulfotransferase [Candidatus Omnitrophica bacterium]|nr:sulfotransferase [Candidatus Omnitrophota bacterium]
MKKRVPTFLIIGAGKSGTTSLYHYLAQHPDIYMAPVKETHYFTFGGKKPAFNGPRAELFNNDVIWKEADYHALFEGVSHERAIGENSPTYLWVPGTAERIQKTIPDVKLICILRNPIERVFSSFSMAIRDGYEPCRTLEEALDDEKRRIEEGWMLNTYLYSAFYGAQLAVYLRLFKKEQLSIHLFDDFIATPEMVLRDIFRFLNVEESFVPDMREKFNVSGVIENPLLRLIWTKSHGLRDLLRPILSRKTRDTISKYFVMAKKRKIEFPQRTRQRLINIFHDDIIKLQSLIGRDLSQWLE